MARKAKVPNHVLKRLDRRETKRSQRTRFLRRYFLIVCEGEKTEPNYFASFKEDLPKGVLETTKIDIEGTGKNTLSLVKAAVNFVKQTETVTGRTYDKIWLVFDRDDFSAQNFNNAIFKARDIELPMDCAWSNEAFELWYLLHFQRLETALNRKDYSVRLEKEITRKMDNPFKYEKNSPDMYQILKKHGDVSMAIRNAEALTERFVGRTDYANHNPCTLVYLLVRELLALGGK